MELDILRKGFVAFLDGLWWGLRDNTGALSMYEGYSGGFRQMGLEAAEEIGGKGPEAAASIAGQVMEAIGLAVEVSGKSVIVESCPIWNRILERGLEFSFHIEEICWKPLLEGIGEKTGATPVLESSLRLAHIARAKTEYKIGKANAAFEKGKISKEERDKQIHNLQSGLDKTTKTGRYTFR
jgi:hypothetical protein